MSCSRLPWLSPSTRSTSWPRGVLSLGNCLGEIAADHQADQLVDVRGRWRLRGDVVAIAQHRDAVADLERLFQVVADVDDGDAGCFAARGRWQRGR